MTYIEIKENIINKCVYEPDFTKFIDFWKHNLECSFKDISKASYFMIIDKNVINNMLSYEKIPVDCRCFAMLYSQLEKILEFGKGTILMQSNNSGMEIDIPDNCFYIKIGEKLDQNKYSGVLGDKQGQWIVKTSEDSYIGITSEKIIETNLREWYQIHHSTVVKKLEELEKECIEDIYRSAMYGILSINIKKYSFEYSLIKFKMTFEEGGVRMYQIIDNYIPTVDCSENNSIS